MRASIFVVSAVALASSADAFFMSAAPSQSRAGFVKSVSTVALGGALAAAAPAVVHAAPIPAVGSPAPAFKLPSNDNGKEYSLEDLTATGKRTVL
jgi:hypothetical protein